jgi:hypothetical protein
MLSVFRPYFEVVKEGRILAQYSNTEKGVKIVPDRSKLLLLPDKSYVYLNCSTMEIKLFKSIDEWVKIHSDEDTFARVLHAVNKDVTQFIFYSGFVHFPGSLNGLQG